MAFTYQSSPDAAQDLVDELEATGAKVAAIKADSADALAVAAAVDEAVERLGGLDILVNNAGVAQGAPIESFPLEDFDRMLAINVKAVFAAIQRAVPHLAPAAASSPSAV